MLEIKNLCVSMDKKTLLKNINMVIQDGARHRLSGHNGSGKSTLVNTIAGDSSYHIDSGQIIFNGIDIIAPSGKFCIAIPIAKAKAPAIVIPAFPIRAPAKVTPTAIPSGIL